MADMMTVKSIVLDRETLPTLYTGDVVVVGGSLGGVATALTMSRAGRKVALVEDEDAGGGRWESAGPVRKP